MGSEGVVDILIFVHENNSARVKDLENIVKSSTTLVRRLNELTEFGVLNRRYLDKRHRLTEYTLTDVGRKLVIILDKMDAVMSHEDTTT